jgi:hypothetical protein
MLRKGSIAKQFDATTPEEEIKDPLVLEFLGLKDEYSESDLEEALIAKLESFLLEMGGDFAFVGRQRRLRIGSQWFRVDRRASTARDSAYGMRLEGYRRDYPLGVARCFLRRSVSAMLRTPRGRSGEHGSSC